MGVGAGEGQRTTELEEESPERWAKQKTQKWNGMMERKAERWGCFGTTGAKKETEFCAGPLGPACGLAVSGGC